MTSKRAKDASTDELDELFEGIGDQKTAPKKTPGKAAAAAVSKPKVKPAAAPEEDILAELEDELDEKPEKHEKHVSRPHTPRLRDVASSAALPRRSASSTKLSTSARNSSDVPRASAVAAAHAPAAAPAPVPTPAPATGGGWWGGLLSTATAAMKTAEGVVKEIQQNEEAKRWAEQISSLKGYGDELRHRALPTFNNILQTLAPPISSHERLLIHITHDMVGYPSLDPLVHGVFSRVMAQVEGGDLLVIQRGQESAMASGGSGGGVGGSGMDAPGWHDGPWWRVVDRPRDLGAVPGLREATKLCRASAEAYAHEYYAAHYSVEGGDKTGLEIAKQRALEPVSETNPVRRSDLFLAVQAVSTPSADGTATALFAASAADAKEKADAGTVDAADEADDLVSFAIYVLDPVHDIVYHTVSQPLPAKWVRWLDAPVPLTPASSGATSGAGDAEEDDDDDDDDSDDDAAERTERAEHAALALSAVPEDIREVIESGGVDPREWVAEWIEETLSLAVGVVAQRYVARRMGVGEGSAVKGKRRMDLVLEDGGGEAARAGII